MRVETGDVLAVARSIPAQEWNDFYFRNGVGSSADSVPDAGSAAGVAECTTDDLTVRQTFKSQYLPETQGSSVADSAAVGGFPPAVAGSSEPGHGGEIVCHAHDEDTDEDYHELQRSLMQ